MGKGLPYSHKRRPDSAKDTVKQTIEISDLAIEIDGATGIGWGTAKLADLPEGNFMLLGAVGYIGLSTEEAAGITDTYNGDYGIGTTPATDGTITAGDVDIVPSTAIGPAVDKVTPLARGVQADGSYCGKVFDNTDGSLELNLNVLIDDADISADDLAFTADGQLHLVYAMLGDD